MSTSILDKIATVQDSIQLQIPVETTVVFGDFEDQPMKTVWTEEELQALKTKLISLINKL